MDMRDDRKATDMVVYLLSKEKSVEMHYKKLMGLMYLSERRYMKRSYNPLIKSSQGSIYSDSMQNTEIG